jgi:hypothetical protein
MKFATVVLLGILLLGSSVSLNAQPAGTSQVVMAYLNEKFDPALTSPQGPDFYVCLTYYTLVGDLDLKSLFAPGDDGITPKVDRAHAYFIWVSDYTVHDLPPNAVFNYVTLIVEGTGTIYYNDQPESRVWTDRTSWGKPVAKFVRKAGMFQSMDFGMSGTFLASSVLVSSTPFKLNGKTFNFRDLIPQGMTCFETAVDVYEAGTCVAIGK